MIETTIDYLKHHHYHQPLLLGTYPTMHEAFFNDALQNAGVKTIVPTNGQQKCVNHLIENELEYGKVSEKTKKYLKGLCSQYKQDDHIDSVILGCTELPIAFDQIKMKLPTINVMEVHIQSLTKQLLVNNK